MASSLDTPKYKGEAGATLGSTIEDIWTAPPDEIISQAEVRSAIVKSMSKLSPREQAVIRLRFGISEPDQDGSYDFAGFGELATEGKL